MDLDFSISTHQSTAVPGGSLPPGVIPDLIRDPLPRRSNLCTPAGLLGKIRGYAKQRPDGQKEVS
jgi:hypothetical protein